MTKGVFLVAFGNPCYGRAAMNLGISIKHFDPDLPITLLHDSLAFSKGFFDMSVFDTLIPLKEAELNNPAKIKTSIYEHLPYDYNLYLDVDALCLQSLLPLFNRLIEKDTEYAVYIFETYDESSPDNMPWMYWAKRSKIWEHYNFNGHKLPATQSSAQWIKKCEKSELIFKKLNENLANPIPLHELSHKWGGGQPDELYLNVTLAQLNLVPDIGKDVLFFTNRMSSKTITAIKEEYFIMSFFGGKAFARGIYKNFYDGKFMIDKCNARGYNHVHKSHTILSNKHADNKTKQPQSRGIIRHPAKRIRPQITSAVKHILPMKANSFSPAIIPGLIDSKKLIQKYQTSRNRPLQVTNWLNPSVIEYKDKKIMAYRMESHPWCVDTKIGICLLDENLQPIKESNVLLNLYSDITIDGKRMGKGFHVEDPRLFVFNNELFISYCDGYQMAQGKINHETLQCEESFYIKKPVRDRTEKNWTFFEYIGEEKWKTTEGRPHNPLLKKERTLFSVYQIQPHIIFEMHGENFSTAYETEFKIDWKWGILRGGNSPVKVNDHYLSFFHSSVDNPKTRERQYFIGAYKFEAYPPFKVTHISKQPFLSGEKCSLSIPRLNNKIYVVFPGGVLRKENSWVLFYGNNDFECRYMEITDAMLDENLIEVVYEKEIIEANV